MDSTLLQMTREIARLENAVLNLEAGFGKFANDLGGLVGQQWSPNTTPDEVVAAVKAKIDALAPKDEQKEPTPMKGQVRA